MDEKDFRPNSSRDYSVDVTKPREEVKPTTPTTTPQAPPTEAELQEQRRLEALERLKNNQSLKLKASARNTTIKKIIIGILAVLLVGLIVAVVVFMMLNGGDEEEEVFLRLSMQVDNKDMTYVVLDTGEVVLREIHPGDTLDISSFIRNSNKIGGDTINIADPPPPIFIRFRVYLILDYEYRYDILKLNLNENQWYSYDAEFDKGQDDHYYYYKGHLNSQESVNLFSAITFYGPSITCDDGSKYGQIVIEVESIEADFEYVRSDSAWSSRPDGWFEYMQNVYYGSGV